MADKKISDLPLVGSGPSQVAQLDGDFYIEVETDHPSSEKATLDQLKTFIGQTAGGVAAIYANIAARDLDAANLIQDSIIEVTDASDDVDVDTGAAWYRVVNPGTGAFKIIAKEEANTKAIVEAYIQTAQSATLTDDLGASTVEVGTSLQPTLTAAFNKGKIYNGDDSEGPDLVGLPNNYSFSGPGIGGTHDIASSNLVENYQIPAPVNAVFGSNQWTVEIEFDAGSGAYYDNKGNAGSNLDASRGSDSEIDTNPVTTGRRYCFFGTGSPTDSAGVRALAGKTFLDGSNEGTVTTIVDSAATQHAICVPAGKSVTIIDRTNLNADVTSDYVKTTFNVNDAAGNPVSYDKYQLTLGAAYGEDTTHEAQIS